MSKDTSARMIELRELAVALRVDLSESEEIEALCDEENADFAGTGATRNRRGR